MHYATDINFDQTYTPNGSNERWKVTFSGNHRLSIPKVKISVVPDGHAIEVFNNIQVLSSILWYWKKTWVGFGYKPQKNVEYSMIDVLDYS